MPIGQNTEYFVLPEVIEVFVDIRKKAMHAGENSNQCEKMKENGRYWNSFEDAHVEILYSRIILYWNQSLLRGGTPNSHDDKEC